MRTDRELIELLYDNLYEHFDCGLCWTAINMEYAGIITTIEERRINYILGKYEPPGTITPFWWTAGNIEPRREFLENLLNKLK